MKKMKKIKKAAIVLLMVLGMLSGCSKEKEYMELADQYFAEGKYDYAVYNYLKVLETDRENQDAYMKLIDSYIEQERYDDAMNYLEEAELMFGARNVDEKREILEELIAETAPKKEENPAPTATEVPDVKETPMPEVTMLPTEIPTAVPTAAPTELAQPTSAPAVKYTFTKVDATMYVKSDVNVRTLPSTDGKKVGRLNKNDEVDVLRRCNETGWYEFLYEGELRYSSGNYFSADKPVKEESTNSFQAGCSHQDMKMSIIQNTTCITDGLVEYRCNVCDSVAQETQKAFGHLFDEDGVCVVCGEGMDGDTPMQMEKLTAAEIYDMCNGSVVMVNAGNGLGTGFFIEENIIVTNYHVIDEAKDLSVIFVDGEVYPVQEVLGYSEKYDIALLKADCAGVPLSFNTHGVTVGEKTYAIGSSLGISHTLTDGMVTNKDLILDDVRYILTNTALSSGNSGGPLLNEYGEVMGITTFTFTEGQNMNCAIDISQVEKVDRSVPFSKTEFIDRNSAEDSEVRIYEDPSRSSDPQKAQSVSEGEIAIGVLGTEEELDFYRIEIEESGEYGFVCSTVGDNCRRSKYAIVDEELNIVKLLEADEEEAGMTMAYLDEGTYFFVAFLEDSEVSPIFYLFAYIFYVGL